MATTAASPAGAAAAATPAAVAEAEEHRWLRILIVPFILGASFFALSMESEWWMIPAFLFGPLLLVMEIIYLSLNVGSQPNP